jgi:NAD(P)-dependent dehydrogenase (short-subunit alcohol dehydrogenase family)
VDLSQSEQPVCLLTGASGALGTAFVARFSDRFQIAGVHWQREIAADTQDAWTVDPLMPTRPVDRAIFAIRSDLLRPGQIERVVELTLAHFGRIDVVVNAAGMAFWGPLLSSPGLVEHASDQFEVNALVPLRLIAAVADQCWRSRADENRRRNRSIVNVSSTAGVWVYAGRGQSVYSASKSALNTMSMHLADELATIGIRVNVLAPDSFPDPVPTDAVADGIAHLVDGAGTGQILVIDTAGERLI